MNITIYTKSNCPNCVAAKQLLKSKGLEYEEFDMDDSNELRRLYALNQELLEALQKIKHHFDTDEYAWEVADAAITKAKEQT